MIGNNGETFGRSGSSDCRYVDDNGRTLTTLPSGEPLCYGDLDLMVVISCERPGATRAEDL
jgi:hypothetical protein